MAALDFPPSSESPFIAPNGVVYVWNDDGYWEADTSEVPSSDNTFLKLDASNDPITGNLTITGGLDVTTKVTAASTTDLDSDTTLVTKDYLNQTTDDATFWSESGGNLYPKTLSNKVGIGTDSPAENLSIFGADPVLLIQDSETGLAAANSTVRFAESGPGGSLDNYWDVGPKPLTNNNFAFSIGGATSYFNIRFDNANVGIGTDSPSTTLELGTETISPPFERNN